MANRSVVLYLRTKIKKKWAYHKASEELSELACGEYYLSWNEGKRKRLEAVGNDPGAAVNALLKKRLELAYIAAGGEIKQPDNKKDLESAYLAAGGEIKERDSKKDLESAELAARGEIKPNDERLVINGQKRPVNRRGLSWTLSREVAVNIFNKAFYGKRRPMLLTATIDRRLISALKLGIEQEVILFRPALKMIRIHQVALPRKRLTKVSKQVVCH